jgi:hypothetical protein
MKAGSSNVMARTRPVWSPYIFYLVKELYCIAFRSRWKLFSTSWYFVGPI